MKKWIALLLAAAMLCSLAACGGKSAPAPAQQPAQEEAQTPVEEQPAQREKVTIEAHIVQTDWADAWAVMEARFEEQYPWIDVESVGEGDVSTDFIATRNAANDLPDITQVDNNTAWRALVDSGKLMDISDRDVCQYIPQSYIDAFTYNGTLMGIPQGAAFSVMYFNMQILKEAGWDAPPANWDELLQCCADVQAAGYEPLAISGAYSVGIWLLMELMIANDVGSQLGQGVIEEQFMNGTFDFTAYPELVTKLEAIVPYILTGSAAMSQEDMITSMSDGTAAMCLGGNWIAATVLDGIASCTGDESMGVATLPPFQAAGKPVWITASPETGFGITVDETRSADEQEAAEIFFDWIFQPENFMLIQNARGTVPILGSMTDAHIKLPTSIAAILGDMNAAPYVKMGFNICTAEFRDIADTAMRDCIGNNKSAKDAVAVMTPALQNSYINQ